MISALITDPGQFWLKLADALVDGLIVASFVSFCVWLIRFGDRKSARLAVSQQFVRIFGMKLEHLNHGVRLVDLAPEPLQGWAVVRRLETAIDWNRTGLSRHEFLVMQEFIDGLHRGAGRGGGGLLKEFSFRAFRQLANKLVPRKHRESFVNFAESVGFNRLAETATRACVEQR